MSLALAILRLQSRPILQMLALAVGLGAGLPASANDWPHWRGPGFNGISNEKDWTAAWPKEGPKQLWRTAVGIGFSSVSVDQGRVFTLGNSDEQDTVFCFDAETGKVLWKYSYPCPLDAKFYEGGPGATPTVDGDRVFTLSKRGHLFCFDAARGAILWEKNLVNELGVRKPEWGFAGSPLVERDLLILNVGGAGVAVNKVSGKVAWASDTNAAGYATPVPWAVAGERCVAILSAKALVGVKAKDGQELWRHPWVTRWDINAPDPILAGDTLFLSTFDRGCVLLNLNSAKPTRVWENKSMANHFNSCVLLDGHLYGIHGNTDQAEKDLRCVEWATGALKWKQDGLGLGSLMSAAGRLIILSERGELVIAAASPDRFRPLARAQVLGGKCWTVPVLAQGRIYCRNAQGTLVCLDVRD